MLEPPFVVLVMRDIDWLAMGTEVRDALIPVADPADVRVLDDSVCVLETVDGFFPL